MKSWIIKLFQKYNITAEKIIIAAVLLLIIIARFLTQNSILLKPIQTIFDLYGKILLANTKLLLSFSDADILFDYAKNQVICQDQVLTINRYFFSINQIVAIIILVLFTKSPYKSKILFFLAAFVIFTLYNSIRISLHAMLPGTNYVHNWISNLILMPRWLLVLLFTYIYWEKYPALKEILKSRFGFTEQFLKKTF